MESTSTGWCYVIIHLPSITMAPTDKSTDFDEGVRRLMDITS